jgi:hypothetical protein
MEKIIFNVMTSCCGNTKYGNTTRGFISAAYVSAVLVGLKETLLKYKEEISTFENSSVPTFDTMFECFNADSYLSYCEVYWLTYTVVIHK